MTAEKPINIIQSSKRKIVFVLGGPGSGKGTQCAHFVEKYRGLQHFSVGDVLRAERALPGSEYAETIAENMRLGRVGPMEITVKLLSNAMSQAAAVDCIDAFLIDGTIYVLTQLCGTLNVSGFPRTMDQLHFFEEQMHPATAALFLDCPSEIRRERLLQRGKAHMNRRQDDDMETIDKRFMTFENSSMEVINYLDQDERLVRVNASQEATAVFGEAEVALKRILDLA